MNEIAYLRSYTAGSKTRARGLRRDVRSSLGTSNDPLPDVLQVLCAVRALQALLDNACGGRFGLAIHDFKPYPGAADKLPIGDAVSIVLDARDKVEEIKAKIVANLAAGRPGFSE